MHSIVRRMATVGVVCALAAVTISTRHAEPRLDNGSRAVLLFNRASVPSTITANWDRVGLKTRKARVRDLWAHTETAVAEKFYAATVPSPGVVMLRVWPIAE